MEFKFHTVNLKKKFPLQISRGIHDKSQNLFVEFIKDGITAWGECAPGKTEGADSAQDVENHLNTLIDSNLENLSIYEVHQRGKDLNIPACALAGIDIALWDWKAKKANMSLQNLLGLPPTNAPTSLTVGINPPEIVKDRVELILQNPQVKALKIKLGSSEGIEYDKLIYSQVLESTKNLNIAIRVDANGGVNLKLMKCGGITEALKILNVARSHGLKTMIGCMSESSVSISAGASITGIIDFVDLDSHYNLDPDPSEGSKMVNGITMTSSRLGHGAKLKNR